MNILSAVGIIVGAFLLMEAVAWLTHRFVMHGNLWVLHRDHHQPEHGKLLQKNDWFFLFFSLPGIALIAHGAFDGWQRWTGFAGIGISLYGLAYFLVHEGVIHRRFRFIPTSRNRYLVALRMAHGAHHRNIEKDGGECYGMLLVPLRFYREAWRRGRS